MTSVLVVEDDDMARDAVVAALSHIGYSPVTVLTGKDALREVRSHQPDLVVLDMGLPDMEGTEAVQAIREISDAPIVVVSGSRRARRKADALDAGADDFIDKPFDVAELRARLRAAERRGGRPTNGARTRTFGDLRVDVDARTLVLGAEEVPLTDIEWRLLDALIADGGAVVTHRRLTTSVWGARAGREVQGSLRVHVASLRRKLGDDGREPRVIRAVNGVGYRWVAPPAPVRRAREEDSVVERAAGVRDALVELAAHGAPQDRAALARAVELAELLHRTVQEVSTGGPFAD